MKCIYDKSIPCEINPDGPMTKDFKCLGCHKPEKKEIEPVIREGFVGHRRLRRRRRRVFR